MGVPMCLLIAEKVFPRLECPRSGHGTVLARLACEGVLESCGFAGGDLSATAAMSARWHPETAVSRRRCSPRWSQACPGCGRAHCVVHGELFTDVAIVRVCPGKRAYALAPE